MRDAGGGEWGDMDGVSEMRRVHVVKKRVDVMREGRRHGSKPTHQEQGKQPIVDTGRWMRDNRTAKGEGRVGRPQGPTQQPLATPQGGSAPAARPGRA